MIVVVDRIRTSIRRRRDALHGPERSRSRQFRAERVPSRAARSVLLSQAGGGSIRGGRPPAGAPAGGLVEELPLEAVEAVDAALALRGRAAELEAEGPAVEPLPELPEALGAEVLHAVLQALPDVRYVLAQGALVQDAAGDALRHLHGGVAAEVAVGGALLHGVDGAHA
eukprot:CAMPEP_0179241536 /NCGR_PEP_ID=MMETSP0797-20121207/16547_1 /TAXON_ID=47934 /ORGANISM="Dinophysis acuminata, Strain DAEP01" /LENGTH=168 /DNA_ID=CAMNT_0020948933 /DNA_START=374 /DNA_END=877 /DNA_ORIENTATION=+